MNLAVINHNSIRIPAELIENAPFIFIVGDGNHYNAVGDGNRILRMEHNLIYIIKFYKLMY